MHDSRTDQLQMRWLPVTDAAGRTRLEATWVAAPSGAAAPSAVTHAA